MEQHPIPQNVSQYQFRLIGNMTLKQFAMLGACVLAAFVVSKIAIIPVFFRYPIAGLLAFLGVAMAFLPFEERSLDVWLLNFIRSIYSPTHYVWRAAGQLPDFMTFTSTRAQHTQPVNAANRPSSINQYLQSIQHKPTNPIDVFEQGQMAKIAALFTNETGHTPTQPPTQTQPPTNNTQPKPPFIPTNQPATIPTMNPIDVGPQTQPQPQSQPAQFASALPQAMQTPTPQPTNPLVPQPQSMIMTAPPIGTPLKVRSLKAPPEKPQPQLPRFSEDQMPPVPDLPNTVVGMVMTPNGQLLANTIIEIQDRDGLPVRAIKSNRLGQFFIATPLRDGTYTLGAEHETHSFDTIRIEAKGNIMAPLKLVSKEN